MATTVRIDDAMIVTYPVQTGELGVVDTLYPYNDVRRYGAKGDGTTNDTTAFTAAIAARIAAGGGDILAPLATYLLDPITVNTAGAKIAIIGQGGGSDRKTTLLIQGTPGAAAEGGFKFDGVEGIKLRTLVIEHTGAVAAANGYGVHFNACNYIEMDDVWVYGFGINILFDGFSIYSKFVGVRSIHGYSACMKWNGALHNGNTFLACQFSNSDAGQGLNILGGGGTANVVFRSCYFEGNASYGITMTGSGLFTLGLDGCYLEANGDWDVYVDNSLASSIAHVVLNSCYFDSNNPANALAQHWRVEVRNAKLTMRHCRIFQMGGAAYYTTPPVRVIDTATGIRGTRPCIAEQCEYETPDICSTMDGWIVNDSKHPFPSYTNGVKPTVLAVHAMQAGQFFWNRLESTLKSTLGWLVKTSGKATAGDPTALATTTIGSAVIALNNTSSFLTTGDLISVAGTTFNRTGVGGSATEAFTRVIDVPAGQLRVDGTAVSAVTGAAITYRQGAVIEVPTSARPVNAVNVSAGGITSWTPISNYSFFVISETNATGHSSIWLQTNGDIFLVYQSDPSARYVKDNAFGTASKINVGYAGGDIEIKNNLASPTTFSIVETAIR
jgi:hypothetical protein